MVKINSTIFRTITDEVTGANKSIGLFGKSFTELKNIFSSVKTNGLLKAYIISDKDRQCINDYNELIKSDVKDQAKLEKTTKGASTTTAQMIKNANGNAIALDKMTIGAKAASVAMKGLAMAGNIVFGMAISWGITKAIEGITKLYTYEKEAIEASNKARKDLVQQLEESIQAKKEEISELESEIDSLNNLQDKLDEVKNNKKGLLALETEIYEQTGYNIDRLSSSSEAYNEVTLKVQAQIAEKERLLEIDKKIAAQQERTKFEENTITNEGGEDITYADLLDTTLVRSNGEKITFKDWVNKTLGGYERQGKDTTNPTVIAEAIRDTEEYFRSQAGEGEITFDYEKFITDFINDEKSDIDAPLELKNIITEDYVKRIVDTLKANNKELSVENIYKEWFAQLAKDNIVLEGIDTEEEINNWINRSGSSRAMPITQNKWVDGKGNNFIHDYLPNEAELTEYFNAQFESLYTQLDSYINTNKDLFVDETIKNIIDTLYGRGYSLEEIENTLGKLSDENLAKTIDDLWNNLSKETDENKFSLILGEIEQKVAMYLDEAGIKRGTPLFQDIFDNYISSYLDQYKDANTEETTATIMDVVDAINSDIKPAISELGEAYQSIFTEDGFNLKAVDNDMLAGLKEAFGDDFKDELEEFAKILTNPLSTENDVQTAFNELVTDYIYASDVLDNLNDTTKDSIVRQFEALGITNAETVATELLTAKNEALAIARDNGCNSIAKFNSLSNETIKNLLNEAEATEETRKYLAKMKYDEIIGSNKTLAEKTKEIGELLDAYDLLPKKFRNIASLINTYEIDEKFDDIQTIISDTFNAINNDFDSFLNQFDTKAQEFIRLIKKEIVDKIPNEFKNLGKDMFGLATSVLAFSGFDFNKFDLDALFKTTTPEITYDKNETDEKANPKDADKETEAKYDWIETKIEHLSSKAEKEAKKATDSIFAYVSKKYKKSHLNSAISFSQEAINAAKDGRDYYIKERNKIGLPKVWAEKVENGAIDIDVLKGTENETLIKQIEDYQELTDKINESTTTIEDLVSNVQEYAEQLANLPIDEAEKKIDKYNSKTDILSAKYDNLNSYKDKNKNLDSQYKYKKAETKARKTAMTEADNWVKTNWYSGGVQTALKSKANKGKSIGDELSTSGLEVGSVAYNAVLKYNEALKVSTEAQNEHALAVESETKTLHDNTKAKYDNITAYYEGFRTISESKISEADATLAYRDAKGYSNVSKEEQKALKDKLKNQNNKTYNLKQERKKYDVNKIEQQYANKEIGFEEYTELISYVNELDASILQSQTDALETKKVLNEIDLTKIGYQADDARRKLDKFSESLSLKDSKTESDYNKQINLTSDTITALKKENEELKELQSEVTKHSDLWYEYQDRIDSNDSSVVTLTSDIHKLAEEMANLPIEEAAKKIEKLTAKQDILSAKYENLNTYKGKNKNLDKQTQIASDETKTKKTAKDKAEKNLKKNWNSKLIQNALKTSANKGKKFGDELSTEGFSEDSYTYKAIVKYNKSIEASTQATNDHTLAVENETKVTRDNTKAKYDNISAYRAQLREVIDSKKSKTQAYLDYRDAMGWSNTNSGEKKAYESLLQSEKDNLDNYKKERKKYNVDKIKQQYENDDLSFPDYKELMAYINELDASILQSQTNIANTQRTIDEFELTKIGYQIADGQRNSDKLANNLALKEKRWGEKAITKTDYNNQLSANKELIGDYKKQNTELTKLRNKTEKYSDQWFEYQEQIDANNSSIQDLRLSNEDLKDSIRKLDYRPYENIHKSVEKTITSIETLISLINDDSLFDDEGSLTSLGTAKFASLGKELEQGKKDVKAYINEINTHKEKYQAYLNGEDNGYSKAEYEEDMEKSMSELYSALSKNKSITDAIISMHTQQQQVIIDALKEEISARNEALQKKKEYYDYDKQIRTKTKDIEALEAQKAALEVTEDSLEKRRKLVELEAELTKQREELEETQKDHEINLVVNGLDKFTEDVQERFDDYVEKLSGSFDAQIEIIKNATTMYKEGFSSIAQTFNDILSFYGVDTKDFDVSKLGIPGYATGGVVGGTSYRGDKLIARVNSGESILTQDFTDLLPHAVNVMQDLVNVKTPDYSHLVRVQPSINVSYDNMINIEGNATNETIVELKKLMPTITKQVTKSIKDDMKKSGY